MAMISSITVNTESTPSIDTNLRNQKRSPAAFFGLYGINSNYYLAGRRYYSGDQVGKAAKVSNIRRLKKKWAKSFGRSQSPYTIAFPALIRTRRWIEQEH